MMRSEDPTMTQTTEPRDPTRPIHDRRPFPLMLVLWVLILWTALGWLRFGQALQNHDLVLAYTTQGTLTYLIGAGLAWGLMGLPAIWGLAARTGWARWVIGVDALLYPAIYWIERLFLWQDTTNQSNWPFMLLLTLVWLGVTLWGLLGKAGRAYFSEKKA